MKKISKTFMKLFLSYTAVLLLPLICMGCIQAFLSQNMQAQNVNAYQNRLAHTTDTISSIAGNIQALSESFLIDKDVQAFINTSIIDKNNMSDMYVWKDMFNKYHLTGANIRSVHLYSSTNNWVIGNGSAVKMDATMYTATLSFTGLTYQQWQEFIKKDLANGFYLMDNGELIYRMNILTTGYRRSILLIRVNITPIAEALQSAMLEGGYISVLGNNGELILSIGIPPFKDFSILKDWGSDTERLSTKIPTGYEFFKEKTFHGWHILAFQPLRTLHSDVYKLSMQLLLVTLLMLLIDIALCLLLSKNNASPLKRLVSFVSSQVPKEYLDSGNEYILIENTMAMLLEKNTNYRQLNDEQRELINYELVQCLLMGEYWNLDRIEPLMRHSCLPMENCRYGVIAIPTRHGHSKCNDMEDIHRAIASYEARILSFHDRFIILFFLPSDADASLWLDLSHALVLKLNPDTIDTPFQLCISNLYDSYNQIHIAYDETVAIMEIMRADTENTVQEMHFSGLSSSLSETYYDYPIDMELQIIHALKRGNTTLMSDLLHEIRVRNYSERKLSAFMSRQLMFEIRSTVIRSLQPYLSNIQIDRHVRALCQANTLDDLFQYIEDLSEEIADILHAEDDRRNTDLEEAIYSFLSKNFTNANLTLEDLVKPIGQSERFLYDFIRERFNSSFSKLLEGLRITKACTLLREGEATIKNVACQVGYNSDHTFRLAFKRVMNVTPSEYASAHVRNHPEK